MKKYVLPIRAVDKAVFDFIKSGEKKIETRAAGPKYEHIQKGDILVLKCGRSKFERKVTAVHKFKSVDAMLKKYNPSDIDPRTKTPAELKKMYNSFPGYSLRLKEYGILAFVLKK